MDRMARAADETGLLPVGSHRLDFARYEAADDGAPTIVLLHEGLGSTAMWRTFPGRLAAETGAEVLVYSRYGYGGSTILTEPRAIDYMHVEALEVLPELLRVAGIKDPILYGHSDGASIALIHAGHHPVRGLILEAPHVLVESLTINGIENARDIYQAQLRGRLAKYHQDVDSTFAGWRDVWLTQDFLDWNIEEHLSGITAPVLAMQGRDDAFGTLDQLARLSKGVSGPCETLVIEDCGHAPHREQVETVLAAATAFIACLTR